MRRERNIRSGYGMGYVEIEVTLEYSRTLE
jgi:hypothetical protein